MRAHLSDPWFDAKFYGHISEDGNSITFLSSIEGAQGLWLWCPCGYGKPEYPLEGARPHGIQVPFANPRNAPQCPENHGPIATDGTHPRWTVDGNDIDELTIKPSVLVQPSKPCWHGFITHGKIDL